MCGYEITSFVVKSRTDHGKSGEIESLSYGSHREPTEKKQWNEAAQKIMAKNYKSRERGDRLEFLH